MGLSFLIYTSNTEAHSRSRRSQAEIRNASTKMAKKPSMQF